jgi:hypothetical protein
MVGKTWGFVFLAIGIFSLAISAMMIPPAYSLANVFTATMPIVKYVFLGLGVWLIGKGLYEITRPAPKD